MVYEAEPTFQILYRKDSKSNFIELPNGNFLSLEDVTEVAYHLVKVVLAVNIINTRTKETLLKL